MSLTKRQPAFADMMEEARRHDDTSHERYLEELYLKERKNEATLTAQTGHKPKNDERPTDERTGEKRV